MSEERCLDRSAFSSFRGVVHINWGYILNTLSSTSPDTLEWYPCGRCRHRWDDITQWPGQFRQRRTGCRVSAVHWITCGCFSFSSIAHSLDQIRKVNISSRYIKPIKHINETFTSNENSKNKKMQYYSLSVVLVNIWYYLKSFKNLLDRFGKSLRDVLKVWESCLVTKPLTIELFQTYSSEYIIFWKLLNTLAFQH